MFPFTNVMHLFANELAGLSTRRLAFAGVFARTFHSLFFRHTYLLREA